MVKMRSEKENESSEVVRKLTEQVPLAFSSSYTPLTWEHNCAARCAQLETLKAQRENRIARVQQLEKQLAQAREQVDAKDEAIAKMRIEINESTQRIQREAGEVCAASTSIVTNRHLSHAAFGPADGCYSIFE